MTIWTNLKIFTFVYFCRNGNSFYKGTASRQTMLSDMGLFLFISETALDSGETPQASNFAIWFQHWIFLFIVLKFSLLMLEKTHANLFIWEKHSIYLSPFFHGFLCLTNYTGFLCRRVQEVTETQYQVLSVLLNQDRFRSVILFCLAL